MSPEACKTAALNFCTEDSAGHTQTKLNTRNASSSSLVDASFQSVALTADEIQRNLAAAIDNQIEDALHEQMDAQRTAGGVTLDAFLAGQG